MKGNIYYNNRNNFQATNKSQMGFPFHSLSCVSSVCNFFFFLKILYFLFDREKGGEHAGVASEGEEEACSPLCREPDAGIKTRAKGKHPSN